MFNTVIQNNREATPFTLAYVSLDPEAVHLQIEYINQDLQDATSNYLVSISTPDTNLLDTTDETIKYIKSSIQPHHYYTEYTTTQDRLTPDISTEERATTSATSTASAPTTSSPTNPL